MEFDNEPFSLECHKPNVNPASIKAMIGISDRSRGAPGSLEAWVCRDCPSGTPSVLVQETIDLTLDSDDEIQEVAPPPKVKEEKNGITNEPSKAPVVSTSSKNPVFRPYTPSPYLETLPRNPEAAAKAYLQALFPPGRTSNHHNILFTSKSIPNPIAKWLPPPPRPDMPKSLPRRHKPRAVLKSLPTTNWLINSGDPTWLSWEDT